MTAKLIPHKVLRPICIAGERVEIDALVDLGPVIGAELRSAGKVERYEGDGNTEASVEDRASLPPTEPAPTVRKPAKPTPAQSV